jgi:amidase
LVEAAPEINGELVTQAFMVLWSAGCAWTIDGMGFVTGRTPNPDQFEPLTWALYEMGRQQSASSYLLSLTILQKVARDIARFFLRYDVWLTPTLGEPPVPLGAFDSPPENPLQGLRRAEAFVPFTPICNATGQPAMSVPLYWNAERLPVGVHFVGRFGDEATLFRLAAQLESARPWAGRRPAVSA